MTAGYEMSSQGLESIINHISIKAAAASPLVGGFIDLPLGMSTTWVANIQATYQQINFNDFHVDNHVTVEYQYNYSAIGFPLFLKYRGAQAAWRPFVAMGLIPAIYTQQQNAWITTTYVGPNAYLNQGSWDDVKKFQMNGALSAGLEYSLNHNKAISIELRFKKLIDAQVGPSQSFALLGSYYF
jgi:hypothetical protein